MNPDCGGRGDGHIPGMARLGKIVTHDTGRAMGSESTGTAGASALPGRLWDRGEVVGAAVLAFAGIAWFGWAQEDPPSSWVPFLIAGSVVSAILLLALVVL